MGTDEFLIADFSNGSFTDVAVYPHQTQCSIMPIVAIKGDTIRALGTCFAISNHGILLTARHVIDEAYGLTNGRGKPDMDVQVAAIYTSTNYHEDDDSMIIGGPIPISTSNYAPNLDIAVLHAMLPVHKDTSEPIRMPALKINPGIPDINTPCIAMGYHKMNWSSANDGKHTHRVEQSYSATKGIISNVFFPARDKMLPFPCFEVDARYDGGMSGGPVISSSGDVIGVVCSSYGDPDGLGHISYASLIGPSLFLQLDGLNSKREKQRMFLYDFVLGGSVQLSENISNLHIERDGNRLLINFGNPPVFQSFLGV